MKRAVTRLYDNRNDALEAAHEIERMGIPVEDVSIVASNKDAWYDENGRISKDGVHHDTGKGVVAGATTGGVIGAGAGLLTGLGLIAIPGIGPVVATGWLASAAAATGGAIAGAAAGGVVGGLVSALTDEGVTEDDAHVLSEGVRRGGTLLIVRTDDSRRGDVTSALDRYRPTDISVRREEYRNSGWVGYDPSAPM